MMKRREFLYVSGISLVTPRIVSAGQSEARFDDLCKLVEAKISSALAEQISLIAAPLGISVSVANGRITLSGTTSNGGVRMKAERIAHAVGGMLQIDNRIISVPSRGGAF